MNMGEWWNDTYQASCKAALYNLLNCTLDVTNTFRWPYLCGKCLQ